ncbi:MAG: hypothetical protein HPY57_03685 [Ignavibacteria bacterium]|nr:hypothetical protein [Ignavibacteria bacterium]
MKEHKILFQFVIITLLFALIGCSNSDKNQTDEKVSQKNYKNINLTILIDLSDRISEGLNPGQANSDIKLINNVLEIFKKYLAEKGVVYSEDKIKVIYYPEVDSDTMNSIIDSLNIDFAKLSFVERKNVYNTLIQNFNKNLNKLYDKASRMSEYPGSDLFNYFKHRLVDDCIIDDSSYLNVLLILTDGYIYHENAKYQIGNRFSYLAPKSAHIQIFRNRPDWEDIFNKQDYGLINTGVDLSNLYIIAAQFNPISSSPKDFDILKKYWSRWFEEQKVNHRNYKILRNDNPKLNSAIIEKFFQTILEN